MLTETKCRRCGKRVTTLKTPIWSSAATMAKWSGICAGCISEKEKLQMLLDMNDDVKRRSKK